MSEEDRKDWLVVVNGMLDSMVPILGNEALEALLRIRDRLSSVQNVEGTK